MKIAAITITYNDDCRLKQWVKLYNEYKDDVYLHIVVDNNSTPDYQELLKVNFPNSTIIELGYNGGCTAAYNAGIKYALNDSNVDAISLIGNDIKISPPNLKLLYNFLYSDERFGMVFPRVQNPRVGSEIINSFGSDIDKNTLEMKDLDKGNRVKDMPEFRICATGPGGCNMAKPSFYKTVGLQDELLFMYSDEVDMGIRAKKAGLLMAITKNAEAWHLHIFDNGTSVRHPFNRYLIARNKTYLARKHYGLLRSFRVFSFFFFYGLMGYLKNTFTMNHNSRISAKWRMLGAFKGLIGDMRPNQYSHL